MGDTGARGVYTDRGEGCRCLRGIQGPVYGLGGYRGCGGLWGALHGEYRGLGGL